MTRQTRSTLVRYTVAIAANAAVVAINYLLGLREHFSSALFLAAVAGSAWYGGLGPGLLATIVAAVTLDYFFVGKVFALDLGSATWMWLIIFVAVSVFLNLLQESQRRLTTELRMESQRKNRFIAVLAHELRNFLSPISSASAVLRGHSSAEDAVTLKMCAVIERQINNMTNLVNDLLDAGRIAQGKLSLTMDPMDVRDAVSGAVESTRPLIEQREHTLQVIVPQSPLLIRGDRMRMEQVIINLLVNAAKYTERDGTIWLTARREAKEVVVSIKDNGRGIAADTLPYIFDLFTQVEPGSHNGLGIGLNLVRGLVERHGGVVQALSDGLGCGAEFLVRLQAVQSPMSTESAVELATARGNPAAMCGRIVDVSNA